MEDNPGHPLPVERDALGNLFRLLGRNIRCVVLNACYSSAQAEEISHHIDCVVGMTTAVAPASAIAFAGAFYQALGFGESIKLAFELGRNQIDLKALAEADVPCLLTRPGVKPEEAHLIGGEKGAAQSH